MGIDYLISPERNVEGSFFPEERANVPSLSELNYLNYDRIVKTSNTNSQSSLISKYKSEQEEILLARTGKRRSDISKPNYIFSAEPNDSEIDQFIIEGRKNDPVKFNDIPTSKEIEQKAIIEAQKAQSDYLNARALRSGTLAAATDLSSSIAATMVDPVNLGVNIALLPIGLGGTQSILRAMLLEAGANATAEAATIPFVYDWQSKIGNKYGLSDAAVQIGGAALLGAGFGAASKVALKDLSASNIFGYLAQKENLGYVQKLAAKYMEKYADINDAIPHVSASNVQRDAHFNNFNEAISVLEGTKRFDDLNIKISRQELIEKLRSENSNDVFLKAYGDIPISLKSIETNPALAKEVKSIFKSIDYIKNGDIVLQPNGFRSKTLSEFISDKGGFRTQDWMVNRFSDLNKIDQSTDIIIKGRSSNNSIESIIKSAQDSGYLVTYGYKPRQDKIMPKEEFFKALSADISGETRLFSSNANKITKEKSAITKNLSKLDKIVPDWKSKQPEDVLSEYIDTVSGKKKEPSFDEMFKTQMIERGYIDVKKTLPEIEEEIKLTNTAEYQAAFDADTKRLVEQFGDEIIETDEGSFTLNEILSQTEKDQSFIKEITSCRI